MNQRSTLYIFTSTCPTLLEVGGGILNNPQRAWLTSLSVSCFSLPLQSVDLCHIKYESVLQVSTDCSDFAICQVNFAVHCCVCIDCWLLTMGAGSSADNMQPQGRGASHINTSTWSLASSPVPESLKSDTINPSSLVSLILFI